MFFSSVLLLNAAAVVIASSGGTFDIELSELYSKQKSGNQYFDEAYLMEATIGTPPQKFTFIADTGSPDTWVQGSELGSPSFNPDKSSSFVNDSKPWKFEYGGPSQEFITDAAGYAARDTVTVGIGGPKLSLKNETFAIATQAVDQPDTGTAGIFGLTYSAHVSSYNAPVYVKQAVDRGLLAENRFGVRLRRAQDAKVRPKGGFRTGAGKITLGGIDKTQFKGPITYAPVQKHKGFWQVAIDGIYVNDKLVESTKDYAAILDTGTSILITTPAQGKDFFTHLGAGTEIGDTGEYSVPCDTVINVKVKIGGTFLPIKAQDLNQGYTDVSKRDCATSVFGVDATNASKNGTYPSKAKDIIVLGVPLLLNTYTIFDYTNGGRVGFAKLIEDGDLPTIAPIDVAEKNP